MDKSKLLFRTYSAIVMLLKLFLLCLYVYVMLYGGVNILFFPLISLDDDNHTSADTTKKCYADTTHYERFLDILYDLLNGCQIIFFCGVIYYSCQSITALEKTACDRDRTDRISFTTLTFSLL